MKGASPRRSRGKKSLEKDAGISKSPLKKLLDPKKSLEKVARNELSWGFGNCSF